jgi:hypothetical protein
VHEIVPVDPQSAGEFLKLAVPRDKRGVLWEIGYRPLETVITNGLSLAQDLFDEGDLSAAERAARWHEIRID